MIAALYFNTTTKRENLFLFLYFCVENLIETRNSHSQFRSKKEIVDFLLFFFTFFSAIAESLVRRGKHRWLECLIGLWRAYIYSNRYIRTHSLCLYSERTGNAFILFNCFFFFCFLGATENLTRCQRVDNNNIRIHTHSYSSFRTVYTAHAHFVMNSKEWSYSTLGWMRDTSTPTTSILCSNDRSCVLWRNIRVECRALVGFHPFSYCLRNHK